MAAEEVHHIVPICEAPHLRLDVKNLVALCKKCHRKRHGSEEK
jgi:5-methylcytosine-specific restriction endonuclease McrA